MLRVFCPLLLVSLASALVTQDEASTAANPIRKVVTMLQKMQAKVTAEGEKEKELYEKFQCYCKTSGGTLSDSIAAAEAKIPAVSSDIDQAESQKAQFEQDLKQHQADRTDAKSAMASATALREKAAADANIGAIKSAVAALEKGMAGGFLQTGGAQTLRRLVLSKSDMPEADRQDILAFLSGGQDSSYAPQSGEITGILKELGDEMSKDLAES